MKNPAFAKVITSAKAGWTRGKQAITEELKRSARDGNKPKSTMDLTTQIQMQQYGIELPDGTDGIAKLRFCSYFRQRGRNLLVQTLPDLWCRQYHPNFFEIEGGIKRRKTLL